MAIFFGGAAAFFAAGAPVVAVAFATLVVVYHVLARDRIAWLLKR